MERGRTDPGPPCSNEESGQAVVEYVLLLSVVVTLFVAVLQGMDRLRITGRLAEFVTGGFKSTYQFGHPDASFGGDSGGETKNHPRVVGQGSNNFRIFLRQE
jgi:hypothetical protein